MLYNSFQFIFGFLPACLVLYFVAARISHRIANAVLALMSLVFYAWWDWHNLPILLASILFNYLVGRQLRIRPSRRLLVAGIAVNLATLAFFKYANFAIWNIHALTGATIPPMHLVLPLGISFFTFTQIAFLVDAWRDEANELNFWRYALFVTFFPHLIAGPIVHHRELMPQFAGVEAKRFNPVNMHVGLAFFILGLFKKVALADSLAPWAREVFDASGPIGFAQSWSGALAYTLQLYFDFSGYSDMAIGAALLFNIRLPDNFDGPYRAENITDFWRRWHMTLSRFLRDYLYIPLGGNRRGEGRRRLNLAITMLLGGLWHGAGWTFVIWGGYHGALLIVHHAWSDTRRPLPSILARPMTFLSVVIGWVFFRAENMSKASSLLVSMAGLHASTAPQQGLKGKFIVLALLLLLVNFMPTTKQWVEGRTLKAWHAVGLGTVLFVSLLCMRTWLFHKPPSEFLYFQF